MSVFTDVFDALTSNVAPLHEAVGNANSALRLGQVHLEEALNHIAAEFHRAQADVAVAEAALADAQRRVDEAKAAAIQIATVGDGIDKLIGYPAQPEEATEAEEEPVGEETDG